MNSRSPLALLTSGWRFLIGRLFKINNVLLDYQGVTPLIYQVFLLLDFFQMLFYVFYKVDLVNEFAHMPAKQDTIRYSSANFATTRNTTTITSLIDQAALSEDAMRESSADMNFFQIADYFKFANFHLYLESTKSEEAFLALFFGLNGVFLAFVLLIYAMSNQLFLDAKNQNLKDWQKLLVKVLSYVMAIYLYIMQIPMVSVNLLGYKCDDTLTGVKCGSTTNKALIVMSSAALIIYLMFLFVQRQLYTSNMFESLLPWASLERSLTGLQIAQKLVLSFSYVFDNPKDSIRADLNLVAFAIGLLIIFMRLQSSILFNRWVHNLTSFYECMLTWGFLTVSLHELSGNKLTITNLAALTLTGVALTIFLIFLAEYRQDQIFWQMCEQPDKLSAFAGQNPGIIERFLYRMTKLIVASENSSWKDAMIKGLIISHLKKCTSLDCLCEELILPHLRTEYEYQLSLEDEFNADLKYRKALLKKQRESQAAMNRQNSSHVNATTTTVAARDGLKKMMRRQGSRISIGSSLQSLVAKNLHKITSLKQMKQDLQQVQANKNNRSSNIQDPIVKSQQSLFVANHQSQKQSLYDNNKPLEADKAEQIKSSPNIKIAKRGRIADIEVVKEDAEEDSVRSIDAENNQQRKSVGNWSQMLKASKNPQIVDQLSVKARHAERKHLYHRRATINELEQFGGGFLQPDRQVVNRENSKASAISETLSQVSHDQLLMMDEEHEECEEDKKIDPEKLAEEELIMKFHFLALFLERAVNLFPNTVELRIHNSYMQSQKLQNEFKGQFELMKAELQAPSMRNRFYIFRRRIAIEKIIIKKNEVNTESMDKIDPLKIYQYEKLYQRYMKLEYLAANSALNFWRELLQKNVDSQVLIDRGSDISKCYARIQNVSQDIIKLQANEMKFFNHYGNFLKMVVNDEIQATQVLEKAASAFSMLVITRKKLSYQSSSASESIMFGENTAKAIIMIALSAEKVGQILHTNEEVYRVLGYQRKEMIGKKINMLNPLPIAKVHDRFLRNFLETAQRHVIDNVRQVPSIAANGYIQPVHICVKLYPQISDKIIVVGCLQNLIKLDGFEPERLTGVPQTHLSQMPHHYLLTDEHHGVACVSEGLALEIGLHAKFFSVSDIFHVPIHVDRLFKKSITTVDMQRQLETSLGEELEMDTSGILEHINLEQLTNEEISSIRKRLGIYPVHLELKTLVFDPKHCTVKLYRVIFLPQEAHLSSELPECHGVSSKMVSNQIARGSTTLRNEGDGKQDIIISGKELIQNVTYRRQDSFRNQDINSVYGLEPGDETAEFSRGSISSTATAQEDALTRAIHKFKQSFDRREAPKSLKKLNLIISALLLAILSLALADYLIEESFMEDAAQLSEILVRSESRTLHLIELEIHVRSLLDVANDLEFKSYQQDWNETRVTRFMYLRQLVQSQAARVQESHNFLMVGLDKSKAVSSSENELISLLRIGEGGRIESFKLPYKVALNQYLNLILLLNVPNPAQLRLNTSWIMNNLPSTGKAALKPSTLEKDLYFILANGLRGLLVKTMENNYQVHDSIDQIISHSAISYLLICLCLGLLVACTILFLTIRAIFRAERGKRDVMKIFSMLSNEEIKRVYDLCDMYLDSFQGEQSEEEVDLPENREQVMQSVDSAGLWAEEGQAEKSAARREIIDSESVRHDLPSIAAGSASSGLLHSQQLISHQKSSRQFISGLGSGLTPEEHYGMMLKRTMMVIRSEKTFLQNRKMARQGSKQISDMSQSVTHQISGLANIPEIRSGLSDQFTIANSSFMNKTANMLEIALKNKVIQLASEQGIIIADSKRTPLAKVSFGRTSGFLGKKLKPLHAIEGSDTLTLDPKFYKPIAKKHQPTQKARVTRKDPPHKQARQVSARRKSGIKARKQSDDEEVKAEGTFNQNKEPAKQKLEVKSLKKVNESCSDEKEINAGYTKKVPNKNSQSENARRTNLAENGDTASQEGSPISSGPHRTIHQTKSDKVRRVLCYKLLTLTSLAVLLAGYFIISFVLHQNQLGEIHQIYKYVPLFFRRYSSLLLAYAYLRERVVNENRYATEDLGYSLAYDETLSMNIDEFYHAQSLETEKILSQLRVSSPSQALEPLISMLETVDSPRFCDSVFIYMTNHAGEVPPLDKSLLVQSQTTEALQLQDKRRNAYRSEIDSVITACNFAMIGDVAGLRRMKDAQSVDFNAGDYDKRTPLHVAVVSQKFEAVRFLIEECSVLVSPVDRWGATPLSDASQLRLTEIENYLRAKGGKPGKAVMYNEVNQTAGLDEFRLIYAAFYGDLYMLQDLFNIGVGLDGQDYDARSALHLASSEGKLEAVKFLVEKGANINIKDSRGSEPLDDAIRENRTHVVNYFVSIISSQENSSCNTFENGFFNKGIQQSIGSFNRKFSDLQIYLRVAPLTSSNNPLKVLLDPPADSSSDQLSGGTTLFSLKSFLNALELFLHFTIQRSLIPSVTQAYGAFTDLYHSILDLLFYSYLCFIVVCLLFGIRVFIHLLTEDTMKSRGILSLVPLSFFKEHREAAEEVIKLIKQDGE